MDLEIGTSGRPVTTRSAATICVTLRLRALACWLGNGGVTDSSPASNGPVLRIGPSRRGRIPAARAGQLIRCKRTRGAGMLSVEGHHYGGPLSSYELQCASRTGPADSYSLYPTRVPGAVRRNNIPAMSSTAYTGSFSLPSSTRAFGSALSLSI